MRITRIILALVASAHFFTANAGPVTATDHQFDPAASDVNKYNLDMSLDNISAANFMYCRWGTLCDSHPLGGGQPTALQFDYLTPPPFSQSSRDLFILASDYATDPFQLSAFVNQWPLPASSSSWTTPLGPFADIFDPITIQPGQVIPDSPTSGTDYFLFRKHQFTPVLFEFQGPRLDPNTSKVVILIHGWNPDQYIDTYRQDPTFNTLGAAIKNQTANTDWKVVGYHWEADADTGPRVLGGSFLR